MPDSRGREHSSRIGFSVAAFINSNVFYFYFLVWSLSRLLCCVGSGSNVAVALAGVHEYEDRGVRLHLFLVNYLFICETGRVS